MSVNQACLTSPLFRPAPLLRLHQQKGLCSHTAKQTQKLGETTANPQKKEVRFNLDHFPIPGPGMADECKLLLSRRGQPGKRPVRAC